MDYTKLIQPERLWSRAEVLSKPSPVPRSPGIYACWFQEIPPGVPTDACIVHDGYTLLYVGISPRKPPTNITPPSQKTLRHRMQHHMQGNAEGSTLRRSLGCLLSERLRIELRRVGSGIRYTFGPGEKDLSDWLDRNVRISWIVEAEPWKGEEELIKTISLPLNLDQGQRHPFYPTLMSIRHAAKNRANTLGILSY